MTFPHRIPLHKPQRERYAELCSPTFYREINSFAEPEDVWLSAEDQGFIEQLRNGHIQLSSGLGNSFPVQHTEFFERPYGHEIERRVGDSAAANHFRRIDSMLSEARRKALRAQEAAKRQADKDIAEAELERERKAWAEEQARKQFEAEVIRRRLAASDLEWEREERRRREEEEEERVRRYQMTVEQYQEWRVLKAEWRRRVRHYVPHWQREELRAAEAQAKREQAARRKLEAKAKRDEKARRLRAKRKAERQAREAPPPPMPTPPPTGECEPGTCAARTCCPPGVCEAATPPASPPPPPAWFIRRSHQRGAQNAIENERAWIAPLAPPASQWHLLDWWPHSPAPGRMFVFEGIHIFVGDQDLPALLSRYPNRLRVVDRRRGVSRLLAVDGIAIA